MAFLKIIIAATAFISSSVLLRPVDACSCLTVFYTTCEQIDQSDVAVHGKVLNRTAGATINDDVTYTVNVITLYKTEPGVTYDTEISFLTGGNSAACGVNLDIGEEYLLGLFRNPIYETTSSTPFVDPNASGQLTVNACGLYDLWSTLDEDEVDACNEDPCDGQCDEYEECVEYQKNGKYYCSALCLDGACEVGEKCSTKPRRWCRKSDFLGCPHRRVCN